MPRLISIALLLLCSVSSHARETRWQSLSQPIFQAPLSATSGIEGPLDSIVEDQQGLMWLSAANGLWRWDSHFLVKARFDTLTQTALTPQIQATHKDNRQRIWIGTNQGLYQLDSSRNTLLAVATEQFKDVSVQTITSSSNSNANANAAQDVLIVAGDRSLFRFNTTSAILTPIALPESMRIYAIHLDSSNTLWVGTDKGLYFARNEQNTFTTLQRSEAFPSNVRISAITSVSAGSLVIGTAQNGLFVQQASGQFNPIALQGQAQAAWIYNMVEERENVLLLGTFGHGLVEIDIAAQTQRHFQYNRLQPAGLSDSNIWCLYRDSRGLVWIGAGDTLNIYDARNTAVNYILGGLGMETGLPDSKVHAVVALQDSLVVANGEHGLINLHPKKGVTQTWWRSIGDPVETLYADASETLYASANFATVSLFSPERLVTPIALPDRPATTFTGAFANTQTTLWLGGTDGLWMYPDSRTQDAKQILSETIPDRRVSALLATQDSLWIGTWHGFYHLPLSPKGEQSGSIQTVAHAALQQQFVSDIYADSLGQIWVATSNGGIFVGSKGKADWQQITDEQNLPGNAVAAIAGESQGKIWVGTSRGIAAISMLDKQAEKVITGNQAINTPYSRGAAAMTAQGEAVFGGKNGLTVVTPTERSVVQEEISLVFTHVSVRTQHDELKSLPLTNDSIQFEALAKRVSFEFVALDYLSPELIQYRYQIDGQDDRWTLLDADHRSVTLTSPEPGDYELNIEYTYDGKHWQSNSLSQRFTVLPAWYQTPAARTASILLLLGAIYVLHQLGLRHYRYRQRVLEQRVMDRTTELVAANQKLSEQAAALEKASLTDALTGLNNRRFLTQNIKRDLRRVQRYYTDCENNRIRPSFESDLLFLVIDLDHFKRINDTHGHQAGDAVLVETRYRLSRIFRDTDYLVRWGGEEFLAVVHNSSRTEAHLLAERVVSEINGTEFKVNDHVKLSVSCSVGFAPYPLQQQHYNFFDWHTTVAIADAALYVSKSRSRDTWTGVTAIKEHASEETLTLIQQQPARVFDHAETIIRP